MRPSEQVLAKAIEHQRAGRLEAAVAKGRGGRVVLERPARLAPLLSQMPLTFCGAVPLDREPTPWWASWAPAEWPARGPAAGQGTRPTELALCGGGKVSGISLLSLPRILGTTLASVPSQGPYLRVDAGLVEPASSRVSECASGSRGGRTGPAGLAAAAVRSGLPLAAGQRGQLLAPDHAPVPAAQKLRKNRLGQQKHRLECLCHTGNTGLAGRWHRHSCRGSDFFSASQSREPAGGDRTSRRGVAE